MRTARREQSLERYAQHSRDLTDRRSAMTLFELLLVLVLLVVLGSLAAPLFEGSFASIRLRRGTDQVLACWSQARMYAIETGQPYQFRFEPKGSNYRVDPWQGGLEPDSDPTEDIELTTLSESTTTDSTKEEVELERWRLAETLPEAILFSSAESATEDAYRERRVTRLDLDDTSRWSAPILFYPDGTTSDASLLLENGQGLFRRATLRALTGIARSSDSLSREEVDRLQSR